MTTKSKVLDDSEPFKNAPPPYDTTSTSALSADSAGCRRQSAIVNKRPEAFSALASFISKFSSICSSDLRLACMTTSGYALFTQLHLDDKGFPKGESLKRLLGCPPDEVQLFEFSMGPEGGGGAAGSVFLGLAFQYI
ncbi:hypothetical protein EDB19DRAFT_2019966 [Suillus lakei]|nr:hypothetical protein EDB19DRAFT_2019966 [Suillus lakei]